MKRLSYRILCYKNCTALRGLSEVLGQTSGVNSSYQTSSSVLYPWEHVEPIVYSARTENEGTFTNAFLMPVKLFAATPGTFARLRQPMLRRVHVCIVTDGLSGAFVVNCDLIKNKNSTVTGLGTCIVHQL